MLMKIIIFSMKRTLDRPTKGVFASYNYVDENNASLIEAAWIPSTRLL